MVKQREFVAMRVKSTKKTPPSLTISLSNQSYIQQQGIAKNLLLLFASALVIVALVTMIFAYKIGYRQGYHRANVDVTMTEDGEELTADNIKSIRLENDILKTEMATVQQERDISLNNLIYLRQDKQELKVENLQLKQVNTIYEKNLMKRGGMPLQVIGAEIKPLPENAFEYHFDVAMLSEDGKEKPLSPKLTLLNATSFVEVPLEPSEYDIKGIVRIRGRFLMPKGFQPRQLILKLSSNGDNLEEMYNWRVGQHLENLPLSLSEMPEVDQAPVDGVY